MVLKVHDTLIQYSSLAQSVEHSAVNRVVVGSSPTGGAWKARKFNVYGLYLFSRATTEVERRLAVRVKGHRTGGSGWSRFAGQEYGSGSGCNKAGSDF